MCTVRYVRPRRPVWVGHWPQPDVQGAIPAGWCENCGREVFCPWERMCDRCLRKERKEYEEALLDLYPGARSGELRE